MSPSARKGKPSVSSSSKSKRTGRFTAERIALLEDLVSQVAIALAKLRADEALRLSEKRYRSLFENMLEGYAYCRMLGENGGPRDFEYLDVNYAFGKLTGLKDVVGRKVTEVIPGIRETNPELFEIYARVSSTGNLIHRTTTGPKIRQTTARASDRCRYLRSENGTTVS